MKRRSTILTAALALLVILAIPMGMRGQTRAEAVYSTCLFGGTHGTNNDYTSAWTASNGDFSWSVANGNTNGQNWNYVKFGRKNVTSVGSVTTSIAYSQSITKVDLTIDAITASKINSIKLYSSSNGSNWTEAGTYTKSTGVQTVTLANPTADQYYKIEFECASGSSNGLITVSKIEYYYNAGGNPTCATPTFSPAAGTYTEAQSVSISCTTDGATIYYTTNGQDPTTNSTVYSGAINVSTNTTIKAMAAKSGYDNSAVAAAEYAFITLNHAGTLEDPYTVADARAAIDANVGVTGVYATGIVSEIVTAYNSTYGNITFDIVDEVGNSATLRAYRCGGTEAANVAVNDIVVVYGNLTKYGSTYEFSQDCQLVSLTHPAVVDPIVTVTPNTINAPAEGADGALAITYENIENFISFDYYFCDANGVELEGNDPDWINAEINENNDTYTLDYIIDANNGAARTAYMKVYTFDDNLEEVYAIVTVNQEEYVAPTYAELPFSFNDGKAAIEETDGLYQEGLGSDYNASTNPNTQLKFDNTGDWLLLQFNERPGTLTFDIKNNSFSGGSFKVQTSENGVTFTDLKTYTEISGTQNEEFTNLGENVRYIKWIYTEKVSGNVGLGNIALAEYTEPQQYTLTVEPFENLELITFVNDEMVMEGDGEIQVTEGDGIMLSIVANEGYVMETLMVNGVNHVNDIADDFTYTFEMPGENVTISATAVEDVPVTPGTWVLTNLADLTEDDVFVIVGDNGDTYAMPVDGGNGAPAAVAVTVVEGTLSAEPAANLQWNISITDDGYTFYPNGETETWLYCTNSNNGVRVGTDANNVFVLDNESGYLKNVATSRYLGIYNSQDWRCYTNTTGNIAGQTFSFYKKKVEATTETYTLNIVGHKGGKGNYSLIAFPFNSGENGVDPTTIDGMITEAFDLYYFNEAGDDEGKEWINYDPNQFNLVSGKGYLYASQDSTSITFSGMPIEGAEYEVRLAKTENAEWSGWNLVGNPFADIAYVADGRDFYTMNGAGTNLMLATNRSLQPMEGVFVEAESNNEALTFTTEDPNNGKSVLSLNLSGNNGLLDRAMVRFGESRQLHKIQLNPNGTKLYITVDGQEYAVVRSEEVGEVPVSFKAEESGRYTISMSSENVEFAYLHLIDNKANTDVDLLATPSYTFEANAADNANRFRLVFSASNGINESEIFAFFNGNNLVINNEGEATLQIIDMMGRVLSNEQINGSYNNSLNLSAGVYVLRLSNGNTVKTQKIVID